jgi:glutamine amidotransferase
MIQIVDYKAGNVTSVQRALRSLGVESALTPDPEAVRRAARVIFPGVGNAAAAMEVLRARGLDRALREAFTRGTPILGICLGAQVALSRSEEGGTACLDLIPGVTRRFAPGDRALKIPHMGWDSIRLVRPHPVLRGIRAEDEFYVVHSYYPLPAEQIDVIADCEYGDLFPAVIGRGNLVAMQFHPEKSGPAGLKIIGNFVEWNGS